MEGYSPIRLHGDAEPFPCISAVAQRSCVLLDTSIDREYPGQTREMEWLSRRLGVTALEVAVGFFRLVAFGDTWRHQPASKLVKVSFGSCKAKFL